MTNAKFSMCMLQRTTVIKSNIMTSHKKIDVKYRRFLFLAPLNLNTFGIIKSVTTSGLRKFIT